MYKAKQKSIKEKNDNVKRNLTGGNKTGIPAAMKDRYEEASGLSLNDVRVYYNSHKPEKLQALAYTQGNRVYIAPGQEKHLQHELGHVVQQKRGMVRTTLWTNGLPVNDDRNLEQQAESGVIPKNNESDSIHLTYDAENSVSVEKSVTEGEQGIIQGVFLQWVYGDRGERYLVEAKEGKGHNTAEIEVGVLFGLLEHISDAGLINKISMEMNSRLTSVEDDSEILDILRNLHSIENQEIKEKIVSALNNECCNWLWNKAKHVKNNPEKPLTPEERSYADEVQTLVESRLSASIADKKEEELEAGLLGADVTDAQRYGEILWKIEKLHLMIDQVKTISDAATKVRLAELIRYDILGYLRLRQRFKSDFKMQKMPLDELRSHFQATFEVDVASPEVIDSVREAATVNGLPATYATEKSQQIPLPVLGRLSGEITNNEPVLRVKSKSIGVVAKEILEEVERSASKDRLVIFRGMNDEEAISILQFFNSSQAAKVEAAIKDPSKAHPFDEHNRDNIANLGKHYGEYAQAEGYSEIKGGTCANVLLAFILKPGAKNLLFSKSLLALPKGRLGQEHEGFAEASINEGTKQGYIGVKAERPKKGPRTYSLGVVQGERNARTNSQLLLQLLIDRVEVRRIIVYSKFFSGKLGKLPGAHFILGNKL